MAKSLTNPLKAALRARMKGEVLKSISPESRARQSKAVTEKVLQSEAFRSAQRVSIYLSTVRWTLVATSECFRLKSMSLYPIEG
ncbi:hypothetical protein DOY81_015587 [Sarcophaga bullata]|nr:hypothetical protein DOY81_015587 [Sarcophaga bullata]